MTRRRECWAVPTRTLFMLTAEWAGTENVEEQLDRLWKQLVLRAEDESAPPSSGFFEALVFALAAALAIQVARLAAQFPELAPGWLLRNAGLFALPFFAAYFARRRRFDTRQ